LALLLQHQHGHGINTACNPPAATRQISITLCLPQGAQGSRALEDAGVHLSVINQGNAVIMACRGRKGQIAAAYASTPNGGQSITDQSGP